MQEQERLYLENMVFLYKLDAQKNTLSMQAYPGGYENVRVIIGHGRDEIELYYLDIYEVSIDDLDTVTLHAQGNGYVFAGGIWQILYLNPKKAYDLRCICSTLVEMQAVEELLSTEDERLVEEAVDQAEAFLKPYCFSPSLLTCHEIDEQTAMPVAQGFLRGGKQRRHVWHMLWDCMINDEAPSALAVTYDPQQTPPFSVSLL